MAYTGSGTQDDPYLVSTLADLRTCARIPGKYVKVISDIDASLEEDDESRLTIGCELLYADEMRTISNIIVASDIFLCKNTNGTTVVRNLNFKDAIFRPTAPAGSNWNVLFYLSLDSAYTLTFYNCRFSIQGNRSDMVLIFSSASRGNIRFQWCSLFIDFEHSGVTASTVYPLFRNVDNGYLEVSNSVLSMKGVDGSPANTSSLDMDAIFRYCTVKISLYCYNQHDSSKIFNQDSYNNILIIDSNLSFRCSVYGLTAVDAENSTNCTFSGSGCYQLTEAQIKSKQYLKSINFIP